MPFARIRSAGPRALLLLAAACAGDDLVLPDDGRSPVIRVVEGDNQDGTVGEPLRDPVIVEVRDASGSPMANATVEFAFTSAGEGGEISPPVDTTDEAGKVQARVLLGDKIGPQTGEAHLMLGGASASIATFTAVAAAGTSENQPPDADFNWHCDDLSCHFTDASADPDGSILTWSWQFGDGASSGAAEPDHDYAEAGTYTVTLLVTDDDGAPDETTTQVSVAASPRQQNTSPQAEFEDHCHERFCSFTDQSSDADGSIVRWSWDFGDGSGSNLRNPIHFYEEKGHYEVTLTVTDDDGAMSSNTRRVDPKH